MTACPCCRQDWPGPDRIALLPAFRPADAPALIITPLGHACFGDGAFALLQAMHPATGGIPVAELRDSDPRLAQNLWRWNQKLEPLGWRIKRIGHRNTSETYGLTEILPRATCAPAPSK